MGMTPAMFLPWNSNILIGDVNILQDFLQSSLDVQNSSIYVQRTNYVIIHFYAYSYFFLFLAKHIILTTNAKTSAHNTDNQIPLIFNIIGKIKIIATWNTKVLKNDISADTKPSFNAVKKDDANMLNQLIIYDNEYNLIALIVISNNSLS